MRTLLLIAAMLLFASPAYSQEFRNITCEGTYQHHLQGICADEDAIYWSL